MPEHNVPSVLHLIDSGGFYGAERVLLELLIEHRHSDYPGILGCLVEPEGTTPEIAQRACESHLPVHMFTARRGLDLRVGRDIARFVKAHDINIVHCHGYKPNIICGFLVNRAVPCLSTAHGWALGSGLKISFYNWLDRCALRRMDCVVGVSDALVDQLRQAGVTAAHSCKILNGIRMKAETNTLKLQRLMERLKIPPGTLLIGSVGRLAPVKGYSYLLTAFREVVAQYPQCHLVIAGEGPSRSELESQAASLCLSASVQFAGFVEEMDEFFGIIDMFVMPSLSEGLPMALLEAMAHEKPCIASCVGGIPEVLNEPVLGILVPPADPNSLATAILSLARSSQTRLSMGEKAKSVVSHRFSVQRMAADYLRLYSRLLGTARDTPYVGMANSVSA